MTLSAERPRLILPGLLPADPSLERYRVRPGAVTAVELDPGDVLTVTDTEGRQRGELTVLTDGREDFGALGTAPDTAATVLRALARPGAPRPPGAPGPPGRDGDRLPEAEAAAVIGPLAARGLDPEQARAVGLFGEWSHAGTQAEFTAQQRLTCVVAAPDGLMGVDEHNPPSDLVIEVRRTAPRQPRQPRLPPPLADPVLDLRVDTATARSYEVEAGQYIQVIDVEGRQCSDFLAFHAQRLAQGDERGLDATTTRNLMGNAYPQPGLFGKFYDQDMRPLVEVVRDTVGRHDTFALACNAKYYEDMGYPGHINCTDNFNGQLARYGIAARRGWPALNFFYNTSFNDANQLLFDEPWSRPGDYVLLRAMSDLVCASSACPDDTVVMDLSPLRKFEVVGPDAEALLQAAVTRNIRKLATGQVVYTAVCNETGGMLDDATVFRLGTDNFRFVGGDEYDGTWLRQLAGRLNLDQVWIKHSTDQLHNIAVQGPKSRDLLRELVWTPPTQPAFGDLSWFRFAIGRIGGPEGLPMVVSRTGYTGELGYELWCHPKDAPTLWDAVWEAGAPHALTPLGLDALDILRIEAGLIFAGYEFGDQVDPFEAGIGFTVALKTKEDDFVGRAALERRKASPQRTLVGLELAGNEPAAHGDCVHVGRSQVGVITSGTRSPLLRTNIALCRMAVEYSEIGTAVDVGKLDGHRKRIPATVVRFPFYDPDKTRPRS
jgi:glycine cleavage system T protein